MPTGSASAATKHHSTHHARQSDRTGSAKGLGQLSGLLPRNKLTLESAIRVNLNNDTVRLPLYPGDAPDPNNPGQTEKVWYVLLDASDQGLAHDLGVNYAPKLANIAISDPAAVQTVTLKYHPTKPGELRRQLQIRTNLEQEAPATVTVEGSAAP